MSQEAFTLPRRNRRVTRGRLYLPTYTTAAGEHRIGRIWRIAYQLRGKRYNESTETSDRNEAARFLRLRLKGAEAGLARANEIGLSSVMTGLQVQLLRAPLVYVWRRGSDVLYVGRSSEGLRRILNPRHHKLHAIEHADTVEFIPAGTVNNAIQLEADLIERMEPRFNLIAGNHVRPSPPSSSVP